MKKVIIIGGGTGGISTAAKLKRERSSWDITIIEPSSFHYYRPLWTLVGAGLTNKEETKKKMEDLIPDGIN